MKRLFLALAMTLAMGLLMGNADPVLVPDVSQHTVEVNQDFTGTELLLFGAILTPQGSRAGSDYDIVVVLEGPERPIVLREKKRVAGVWVNADSTTFQSAPGYYAMASTRPHGHESSCLVTTTTNQGSGVTAWRFSTSGWILYGRLVGMRMAVVTADTSHRCAAPRCGSPLADRHGRRGMRIAGHSRCTLW